MDVLSPEDLVFIDECGVNTNMARRYARAPRGVRAYGRRPGARGKNVTVIGAVSLNKGFHAVRTYLGSMNGPRFIQWLKNVLLPTMEPGQTLVLDNLRVHHIAEVREHVESINCHLLYLPPYSPDMNPIELAWSKLKNYLRKRSERLSTSRAVQTRGVPRKVFSDEARDKVIAVVVAFSQVERQVDVRVLCGLFNGVWVELFF